MAMQPHILVVEDEAAQREILTYNLEAEGYRVSAAATGDEALALFDEDPPDLIVLDWMLPEVSGIEICRRLRRRDPIGVPIIMVSARSEETDRVRGLDTGADDYVTKPYSPSELMARVRSNLRRAHPGKAGASLEVEDIVLDPEMHRVHRSGQEIHLGPLEFKLLMTLMEKPGRAWSRDQLLDQVWGRDIYVDTRSVDVLVGRLRKSLSAAGGDDPIRTIRGTGYALG
ncbi:phosphate regulon transcriptional regulator PhoB [Palleronia caenipelagi]|uniref:Phosphate regulon transcriptional regulatory protein PhoB n=1 Tax=Palleronia caenipelagi TaxID=2489174 RepID=A0A547Q610_9RHOB|nr:phosphate regulon transcriptional regulator PhoB [Palleronia caenipelagi]TRD21823.1 phosphate regulon transcriptional regulatory protein PhoB [Palleronia caenipelagi]